MSHLSKSTNSEVEIDIDCRWIAECVSLLCLVQILTYLLFGFERLFEK